MNTKLITTVSLLAAITGLIGWDIFVAANSTPGDTISEITLAFAYKHPFVPLAVGVICGHLFWPMRHDHDYKLPAIVSLNLVGASMLGLDASGKLPEMIPVLPFIVGVPLGHLLWPQQRKS